MSNEHKDWIKENNYEIVKEVPILGVYNYDFETDSKVVNYSCTLLDFIPPGWRNILFEMAKKIQEKLDSMPQALRDNYEVLEVKEKYNEIRWYTSWTNDELDAIIDEANAKAVRTCCICGNKATRVYKNYIASYCDECGPDVHYTKFAPIEEWLGEV